MDGISFSGDTLGTVVSEALVSRAQLDKLTRQSASGKVADTYGGLSRQAASVSLSVRPALVQQQALQDGIDAVQGRLDVAQTSLSSIGTIASNFFAQTQNLNGLNASAVDSIAADARDALAQVANLLDAQDGTSYVFAGSDSANPPIPEPDQIGSSAFTQAIKSAVAGLDSAGADATAASTLAIAAPGGTSPFSAALTTGTAARPVVSTGHAQSVAVGVLADSNGDVASLGTSTTGSYMRDILRALATLGSLSSSDVSSSSFSGLVADTRTSLGNAITALNQDAGVLGDRQTALAATRTTLSDTSTALKAQVSTAEDVDMTLTLSQLTQAQTRLQSSYQLISGVQSLSLTKFL